MLPWKIIVNKFLVNFNSIVNVAYYSVQRNKNVIYFYSNKLTSNFVLFIPLNKFEITNIYQSFLLKFLLNCSSILLKWSKIRATGLIYLIFDWLKVCSRQSNDKY